MRYVSNNQNFSRAEDFQQKTHPFQCTRWWRFFPGNYVYLDSHPHSSLGTVTAPKDTAPLPYDMGEDRFRMPGGVLADLIRILSTIMYSKQCCERTLRVIEICRLLVTANLMVDFPENKFAGTVVSRNAHTQKLKTSFDGDAKIREKNWKY